MARLTVSHTRFPEVLLVTPEAFPDKRGFFMETYSERDYKEAGINDKFVQDSQSNSIKGVLRGLHFQLPPHPSSKLVRCLSGEIWDVVVDLRPLSPTFKQWQGFELSAENRTSIYVPIGFAHGFYVKSDKANVAYKVNEFFYKECDSGIRWDDPGIGILWPSSNPILSEKDKNLKFLKDLTASLLWK